MLVYVLETQKCFEKYQNLKEDEITNETWDEEGEDNDRLKILYSEMENELDKYYLDLPISMINNLRNYMWGVMFDYHDAVAIGKLENDNPSESDKNHFKEVVEEMTEYFARKFYEDVAEIFDDYMVHND